MAVYFKGISPGLGAIQAQWYQQVKKASQKYQKTSPVPGVERDPVSSAVELIRMKLRAGQKLSPAELDLLRERAPDLYAKAVRVAQQRDTYEKSLRQSQSKKEADQKQNQQMALAASSLKSCDPEEAEMLMNALQDASRKYRNSEKYSKLEDEK
jgi:hypothetical protein